MKLLVTMALWATCLSVLAQNPDTRQNYRYPITQTTSPIIVDGIANEDAWLQANKIEKLMNHWPKDQGEAEALTEVWTSYDDEYFYVLAKLYDEGSRVVQSLKRDNVLGHWNSDNFTLVMDPFNNKQSGFFFGVNAGGAQIEALLNVSNGQTDFDENWDNKWFSEVREYEDHWLVEMAIPFKT
ncbi:MAG: carbohydrate binding family 9 domain-containing protein, partial [Cytophagia bacterium]|nr:carbohydrate binding family 9 domain-containing protein [Cytophagia bacterium]